MAITKTTQVVSETPLYKYWSKSNIVDASSVPSASNKKYLWVCQECGKEFERGVATLGRTNICLCKECTYKRRALKTQDLRLEQRGNIMNVERLKSTWDFNKNEVDPSLVLPNSCKLYWWVCPDCGKSFQRSAAEQNRALSTSCYSCSLKRRKKPVPVFVPKTTAISNHPKIKKLWSPNNTLSPEKITIYSRLYCLFVCPECGAEYERTPKMVTAGQVFCKKCARVQAVKQTKITKLNSDFVSVADNPILLKIWDFEKNAESPDKVPQYSKQEFFWKCSECGASWKSIPVGKKYPLCSECLKKVRTEVLVKNIIAQKGSFGELYPQWAAEWNTEMNNGLTAFDVLPNSHKYYYFTCKCGHIYRTTPYERIQRHAGCSVCNKMSHTSFTEQAISFYLEQIVTTIANYKTEVGLELDAYLPEISKAVEYDGSHWHSQTNSKDRDERTTQFCKDNGIFLVRIKEIAKGEDKIVDGTIFFNFRKKNYQWLMDVLCDLLEIDHIETNIDKDSPKILARCSMQPIETSFATKRPELLDYWDIEQNLPIKPDMIGYTSEHILSWHCPVCGLYFKANPKYVSLTRYHCPQCSDINRKKNISLSRKKRNSK